MEALVLLVFLGLSVLFAWLFYLWGASIAEGKGRSRALGWWAVFFGFIAILILYLLPAEQQQYVPAAQTKPARGLADQLDRLAALRDRGAITDDEFEEKKRSLLGT